MKELLVYSDLIYPHDFNIYINYLLRLLKQQQLQNRSNLPTNTYFSHLTQKKSFFKNMKMLKILLNII